MTIDAEKAKVVSVSQDLLEQSGFTKSGSTNFQNTVEEYAQRLMRRAVLIGEAQKADGMKAEITHDHVRSSAFYLSSRFGIPSLSKWLMAAHTFEYVATAVAGVGGGNLDKPWGIATFGIGISIAVILIVYRLSNGKGD